MQKIINENIDLIRSYCHKYDVKRLYAFGSVTSSKFQKDSDIDLLISFRDIPVQKYTNNYFILHELLEKLFNRPVDLITERSLSNPFLIKSINNTKSLIYEG